MEYIKLLYNRFYLHKLETDPTFATIHNDPSYLAS